MLAVQTFNIHPTYLAAHRSPLCTAGREMKPSLKQPLQPPHMESYTCFIWIDVNFVCLLFYTCTFPYFLIYANGINNPLTTSARSRKRLTPQPKKAKGKRRKHRQMANQQDNTAGKIASRGDGAHSVSRNSSRIPARGQTEGATSSTGLEGAARRLQLLRYKAVRTTTTGGQCCSTGFGAHRDLQSLHCVS